MAGKARLIAPALLALGLGAAPLIGPRAEDAAADKPPLATIRGDTEGVHVDVLSLERTGGGLVTLRVAFVNESGAPVKNSAFPGVNSGGWRPALIDYQSKRAYGIAAFEDGSCLCTTDLVHGADFEPGRKVLWAKFRAPPESVRRINLLAVNGEPVDGIPITR